jgi:hypothetical protein
MAEATMHDGKAHRTRNRSIGKVAGAACGALALGALAGCGADTSQAVLCERVVEKLYGGPGDVTIVKTEAPEGTAAEVSVQFRQGAASNASPMTVTCSFAGKEGAARLDLTGVRRPDNRPLHLVTVIFLKRQLQLDQAQ